jgi:hypothetical protein
VGFGTNFIWGGGDFTGGAQDVETGVAGGAGNNVGTVFYLNSVAESPGGPFDPTFNNKDVYITNFHKATDTVLINPLALALLDIPTFLGDATDYGNALALLAGGGALQTQAVYQLDQKVLWVDADNNGLLNQLDIRVFVDFGSHGFNAGSFNFGNLLGLFTGADVTNYVDPILNPASNVTFSGTLAPGEFLFGGGPGNNDKLTLSDGNVENGILIGFEHLEIASGKFGEVSMNQWNSFWPQITGPGTNTAKFSDGIDAIKGNAMTTVVAIENYDFSLLTYGITMTTPGFDTIFGPFHGPGTVIGTNFDDTFNTSEFDLKGKLQIDGLGGADTLNVDAVLTFGNAFGQVGPAGTTNAVVLNVETLNLLDPAVFPFIAPANVVGFNAGTQFNVVNGTAFADVIIDPEFLAGAWTLNLGGGSGGSVAFGQNIVRINNTAANLSPGTITAVGGQVALQINVAGSNTTMTFAQYTLFQASFSGIFLTDGATFANTTITFSDQVTGGAVLNAAVRNWVFQSAADDTFTLGNIQQWIDISGGGNDTAILSLPGLYNGTWTGGSGAAGLDTIRFTVSGIDISGINGGGNTTFGIGDFNNANISVSMTTAQHIELTNFVNVGNTQTVTLTTGGLTAGDGGIENYFLVGGAANPHTFQVYPDGGTLVGGKQNVTVTSGGAQDLIKYGTGTFTGNLTGLLIADNDIVEFTGNADIKGVNGGGVTGAKTASFLGINSSVTMTTVQHEGFTKPFINTNALLNTITLTTGGTATGDAGIEDYFLIGGAGLGHNFTVVKDGSMLNPPQDVTVTAGGAQDTIRYGDGTFSGLLGGLLVADNDIVQFFGNADIKMVNIGGPTNAKTADFSGANISVTMTLAQHNGFTQPFTGTANTQTITLINSGVATGDGGIEQYNLDSGNDTFTVAPDGAQVGGNQDVDFGNGIDTAVFGTGTFTGTYTNIGPGDTTKFVGDANISGANTGNSFTSLVDFNSQSVSVTITDVQHNGWTTPFGNTGTSTQTISITDTANMTGDVGIEQYRLLSNGNDTFRLQKDNAQLVGGKQNVNFVGTGNDTVLIGNGVFTGNVLGFVKGTGDTVVFEGTTNVDVSGVNGGGAFNADTASFNGFNQTVTMTLVQHNDFVPPFTNTLASTQTIKLTTSGIAAGDVGIEQYILASGDDTFTVTPDNGSLVGGKQNVDISSGGNDTINYGVGTFTGNLVGGGAGDTVQFTGGATDVKGVNGGAVMGPKAVSFSNTAVNVTMTVVQHNDFTKPFTNTGNGGGTQTINFSTDGTATGDIGIEQYILGADGTNTNNFTVGIIGQNVTGLGDNDTVINPFGGLSGVLKGGGNTATGDTLILQGANTTLAAGSGEFENLTLTVPGATVTSNTFAHNGFTGVINAPGVNTYTLNGLLGGVLTGLFGIENYVLGDPVSAFYDFTFTDSQTGTVTSNVVLGDFFNATASQIANMIKLDANALLFGDVLNITTDAGGLNLNTKTSGIEVFNLLAGSTTNVQGANGNNITVNATGNTTFTMGSVGAGQQYVGSAGIDDVTFNVGSTSVDVKGGNDTVTSLVGAAFTAASVLDGGANFDKLSLTNNDDIRLATVTNFEDLLLANNATVTMTGTQYNKFTTNSQALGTNTINIDGSGGTSITTSTFANVENYNLTGNANDHTYSIAGNNQTVTDSDSAGTNTAAILAGLSNVTLSATAGVGYIVNDTGGGAGHSITLGGGVDTVNLDGGQTGLAIDLGAGNDTLNVKGIASGTLNGGADTDKLHVENTANLSGATVSNFENLDVLAGISNVTLTGAIWDQFVATTGAATGGHTVTGGTGTETVTLSSTTPNITTAYSGTDRIENYVLSNTGDDFFRVNNSTAGNFYSVNITAGGSDRFNLNDNTAAVTGVDVHTTTVGFTGGATALGGDVLQVQLNGASLSSGGFELIVAADTDVGAGNTTLVIRSDIFIMGAFSNANAQTAWGAATDMIAAGNYTGAVYFNDGGNTGYYIMAFTTAADMADAATYDLVGVLSLTAVNTLTAANFT